MATGWRTVRHYATTVAAQGAILSLGILTGIVSARILGPTGRGILTVVTVWPSALAFLASCGMNQALVFHLSKTRHTPPQILGALLEIGALQSFAVVLAGVLILPLALQHYPPEALRLGFWCLAFAPVMMLGGYPANVLQALGQRTSFNVFRTIPAAAYLAGLLFLVVTGMSGVGKVVASQLGAYAVALVVGIVLLAGLGIRPHRCRLAIRDMLAYGSRAQVTNMATYFNQRCDQLVLSLLVPPRELGLYAVAVTLAMAVTFVPQAAGLVTFADAARQGSEAAQNTIATAFRLSLVWLAVVCLLLYLVAPLLIGLVFGRDFAGSSVACRILLPGMVAAGLNQVLYAGSNALGHPTLPSLAELSGMILTVAGLIVLVPRYGYIAAAAVSTASYVTSFVVMLWLSSARLDLRLSSLLLTRSESAVPAVELSV